MMMFGKYPAVVMSYDGGTRLAKVKLEPLDEGADTALDAELFYPLGDKSNTAIEILDNDPVWVEFEAGDPRYPIIVGYRNKREGNDDTTRRYHHHGNFELKADQEFLIEAGQKITLKVAGSLLEMDGDMIKMTTPLTTFETSLATFSQLVNVLAMLSANGGLTGVGNTAFSGGTMTHNGKNFGDTHTHRYTDDGVAMTTDEPS
ncbi:hypothetical protein FK216_11980 [Moraxellaceae bacterium AER2_44_116]|nr:hypothetical protein FK216_11980 [Moraxellaceae bacterium AER2_44_116]